jgi:PPK2 family polyphosphate:nucleotide phosphotransferase
MAAERLIRPYRIDDSERFKLSAFDCADTCGLDRDKDDIKAMLAQDIEKLADLQKRLYAQNQWAILVVLQGMDTSGKDGIINHVMGGVNPQGCEVHPFKAPSDRELEHSFLHRAVLALPERGHIGIFNRSYYEEVLVVRVHPDLLERQKLPPRLITKSIWSERFEDIRAFEQHLARSGTLILKFFLHLSKEEQRQRLLDRLDEPDKRWKFSMGDIAERKLWDKYMAAYQDMIRATSRPHAPWYVVPADHKWFARLTVARAMVDALERLDLGYPKVDARALKEMRKVRKALKGEKR